jgi:hypothetical protein
MKKLILQTSRNKPSQEHIDKLMGHAPGWAYSHFNDEEIIDFFNKNPILGFEDISIKFYQIRRGEHRADLFRYYYIYLNGGLFLDYDLDLLQDINLSILDYDFVSAEIRVTDPSIARTTNRSRAFNGYMYANKNHPIIYRALLHLYNIDIDDIGPSDSGWDSRYHIVCEQLYHIINSTSDIGKIKMYRISDNPEGSFIFDNESIIAQHLPSKKDGIPYIIV